MFDKEIKKADQVKIKTEKAVVDWDKINDFETLKKFMMTWGAEINPLSITEEMKPFIKYEKRDIL